MNLKIETYRIIDGNFNIVIAIDGYLHGFFKRFYGTA